MDRIDEERVLTWHARSVQFTKRSEHSGDWYDQQGARWLRLSVALQQQLDRERGRQTVGVQADQSNPSAAIADEFARAIAFALLHLKVANAANAAGELLDEEKAETLAQALAGVRQLSE